MPQIDVSVRYVLKMCQCQLAYIKAGDAAQSRLDRWPDKGKASDDFLWAVRLSDEALLILMD